MTALKISEIHCADCSVDLIQSLERICQVKGFVYRGESGVLQVPDGCDLDLVRAVLASKKISDFSGEPEESVLVNTEDQETLLPPGHTHGQSHAHGHSHSHSHSHSHIGDAGGSVRSILVVFSMNLLFALVEFITGLLFNSTAIFSDAVHDLGDAISTGMAFFLEKKASKHADGKYSFGQRRFSLLGALLTGLVLIVGGVLALWRAVPRLLQPEPVEATGMFWLALAAIAMNGISAFALRGRSSRSERMLNLHMLEDLIGWVAVLGLSIVLHFKPWYFLDPIVSIAISLFILYAAIPQTVGTLRILMESVPENVNMADLAAQILQIEGVHGLSHLHIWSMDGEVNNFAVTLFVDVNDIDDHKRIKAELRRHLAPHHVQCSTIELDYDPGMNFRGIL